MLLREVVLLKEGSSANGFISGRSLEENISRGLGNTEYFKVALTKKG